ncbi:MAG: peptide chain release factor N(5)-glutamine methyltransferase [Hyphomicrobiales bacterium]|nr:peptide chain release factor N(5)-glutamine methyltransferase [Hyphomicrobiales bacterium]
MTRRSALAFGAEQPANRALSALRQELAAHKIPGAALEARCLVEAACGFDRAGLVAQGHRPLGEAASRLAALAARRLAGEPLARLLGAREFWGLAFLLSPTTLVPRPETETLVEAVLRHCEETQGKGHAWRVLDLGTGSGCIGISLLTELPRATLLGTDLSAAALMTARANARHHGVAGRASFIAGDWAGAVRASFDLVVANPPYVANAEIPSLAVEVREHDPHLALSGGADGLDSYRELAKELPRLLSADGRAFLEIGAGQLGAVRALFEALDLIYFSSHPDLAAIPRVIVAGRPHRRICHEDGKGNSHQRSFEIKAAAP